MLRFILGRARTVDEVDAFWGRLIDEQTEGPLGMWVGSVDGAPVGWWSLWPTPAAGVAEAGWRLRRAVWGRGLASKGARGSSTTASATRASTGSSRTRWPSTRGAGG